jgi:isochorismate synthase
MSDSSETNLRRALLGASPDRLVAVTLEAPHGRARALLRRTGESLAGEPCVLWSRGDPEEGIWVGRGAAVWLRADGPERFETLQRLLEKTFATVEYHGDYRDRLRAFGGGAFFASGPECAARRTFGAASFVLPRVTYVDGARATVTVVGDGSEVEATLELVRSVLSEPEPRTDGQALPSGPLGTLEVDPTAAERFRQLVIAAKQHIAEGHFDKVVLARRVRALFESEPDLGAICEQLLTGNADSVRFAYAFGKVAFLGATPERLVKVRGLEFEVDALAGTIPKSASDAKKRLFESVKDRREHAFVVEAIRSALAPIASELTIDREPELSELPQLYHLRTPIRGRFSSPRSALEVAARLHPTPAVGGYPTAPAVRFIEEQEAFSRGWYAGPFGWVGPSGDGEFVVALRSALVDGVQAELYAGAGIVSASSPEAEFEETELKLGRMLGVLGLARPHPPREQSSPRSSDGRASALPLPVRQP